MKPEEINREIAWHKDRFASKFVAGDSSTCWEWTGGRSKEGYGLFYFDNERILAHRYSWIFSFGGIPSDQCVLHRCDNPPCVNPVHLFLGSLKDNVMDMDKKGRRKSCYDSEISPGDVKSISGKLSHVPDSVLAKHFGISKFTVHKIRTGGNVLTSDVPDRPFPIETWALPAKQNAKLSAEDVAAIKGVVPRYGLGRKIASHFGVSGTMLTEIWSGRQWSSVDANIEQGRRLLLAIGDPSLPPNL